MKCCLVPGDTIPIIVRKKNSQGAPLVVGLCLTVFSVNDVPFRGYQLNFTKNISAMTKAWLFKKANLCSIVVTKHDSEEVSFTRLWSKRLSHNHLRSV